MANIRTPQYYGLAWSHDDVCYHIVTNPEQPTFGAANTSAGAGDTINWTALLYDRDDNNVWEGEVHRTWSACERCVSRLPGHFGYDWGPGTYLTAPYPGIFRAWSRSGYACAFLVNDHHIMSLTTNQRNETQSSAMRIMKDDVVRMSGSNYWWNSSWIFLPYVWPQ
jgi:hypothetical protein